MRPSVLVHGHTRQPDSSRCSASSICELLATASIQQWNLTNLQWFFRCGSQRRSCWRSRRLCSEFQCAACHTRQPWLGARECCLPQLIRGPAEGDGAPNTATEHCVRQQVRCRFMARYEQTKDRLHVARGSVGASASSHSLITREPGCLPALN